MKKILSFCCLATFLIAIAYAPAAKAGTKEKAVKIESCYNASDDALPPLLNAEYVSCDATQWTYATKPANNNDQWIASSQNITQACIKDVSGVNTSRSDQAALKDKDRGSASKTTSGVIQTDNSPDQQDQLYKDKSDNLINAPGADSDTPWKDVAIVQLK